MSEQETRIKIMESFFCPRCGERTITHKRILPEGEVPVDNYVCKNCLWNISDSIMLGSKTKEDVIRAMILYYKKIEEKAEKERMRSIDIERDSRALINHLELFVEYG